LIELALEQHSTKYQLDLRAGSSGGLEA